MHFLYTDSLVFALSMGCSERDESTFYGLMLPMEEVLVVAGCDESFLRQEPRKNPIGPKYDS